MLASELAGLASSLAISSADFSCAQTPDTPPGVGAEVVKTAVIGVNVCMLFFIGDSRS
jgi:hypothetical protein